MDNTDDTDDIKARALKQQALAYGKCWHFVVEENGSITAILRIAGKRTGVALFYRSWTEALQDIAPVSWTHVFVQTASDYAKARS